jgi:hypothetical protein
MSLPNTSYNLATGNKWILTIPFHALNAEDDTEEANLSFEDVIAFNLYNFSIPSLSIGEADFSIFGVGIPIPTNTRNEDKSILFNYMLSSNWHQYRTLYKWFSLIAGEDGGSSTNTPSNYLLDVTVTMISEYKNEKFDLVFHGAWLKELDTIDLNYQNAEANISHAFTLRYAYYTIENLIEK